MIFKNLTISFYPPTISIYFLTMTFYLSNI